MKKRIVLIVFLLTVFGGCSVSEKMNPDIFLERLSVINEDFDYENIDKIHDGKSYLNFIEDKYSTEFLLSFWINGSGDINKISFACNKTDKAENFIKYIGDIISVYSPDENADLIIKELTENGKVRPSYSYYETQWYSWSAFSDENGLYFSVINKKLYEHEHFEIK